MDLLFTMLVPLIMAAVALYGMARRVEVYDALVQGAGDGLGVLVKIVPPLVGLLTAVYMLRASGVLELASGVLAPVLGLLGIPAETAPLLLVRPVSGSAALGVGAELISAFGPDSLVGRTAAVLHRDDLLYHCRLFRRGGHCENPLRHSGGAVRRSGGLRGLRLGGAGHLLPVVKSRNAPPED